ncbi:methyl-accepting chemotaxis protein [Marinobacter sp. NFXS9]|uniref:HAMP domain-containing methyl-accepting chemotaxis protein n=1 Tax=Marinobacter sp. NFXS9 TaxID=2818433 RepID=UPI0032DF07E3
MHAIFTSISHLSVGNRLFLGFGLTCLLTLVVGISGFQAISLLNDSNQRARDLSSIQAEVLQVRIAEKTFAQERSEAAAKQVKEQLDGLERFLREHPALVAVPEVQGVRGKYQVEFERFDQLQRRAVQARTNMQQQADEVRRSFEVVEQDFFDAAMGLDDSAGLRVAEAVRQANDMAELVRMQLTLRTLEFAHDLIPSAANYDAWYTYSAGVTATLESLLRRVEGPHREALEEAMTALQRYIDAFADYRLGLQSSKDSEAHLVTLSERMLDLVDEAHAQEALALERESRLFLLGVGAITGLAILLGLSAAWLIRRLTLIPLQDTLAMARCVAEGDLGADRLPRRRDEFGILQEAMRSMTSNLRELVGHIDDGVRQLSSATVELARLSVDTLDGMNRQCAETEQTSCAMQQMTATALAVAKDAEGASVAALEADGKASGGERLVQQVAEQIRQLSGEMRQTAVSIDLLDQESRGIVRVLEVIKGLAEQTNMLALNAAIEAARAGDHGRGFAVVAEGVRTLAGRTRQSADEIEQTIGQLLTVTERVVGKTQAGMDLLDDSVELTEQAGSALEQITRGVSVIEKRNQQIAAAAEQQNVVAGQVNDSVARISSVTQSNVCATQAIDASTRELVKLGERLQQLTQRFRVDG